MKVYATIPDEWKKPLEEIAKREGYKKVSRLIYELIRVELKKRGYLGDENRERS